MGCKKEEAISIDNSFEFTLQDTAGVTINKDAVVKLSVKKNVETKKGYTVEFNSDKGELASKTINFEEDYANTFLRLDENESIYYLTAKIKDETGKLLTEKSLIYTAVEFKDDFDFFISDTTGVKADGSSEIKLSILGKKEKYDNTTVTFTPTNGGTVLLNNIAFYNKAAISYFRVSRLPGNSYITASIKKDNKVIATKSIVVKLAPALPSFILMSSNKSSYNLSDIIILQTVLFDKNQSTNISEGLRLVYNAYQVTPENTKISIGNFIDALDVRTNSEGKVGSINFMADSKVDTTKNIYIESAIQGASGTISKILELKYRK